MFGWEKCGKDIESTFCQSMTKSSYTEKKNGKIFFSVMGKHFLGKLGNKVKCEKKLKKKNQSQTFLTKGRIAI